MIDTILNFKYAAAKQYGIMLELHVFIPNELPIQQSDLGIIIGNAMDNAIEAVKVCTKKEKTITLSMGIKKQALIMFIRNPYEHEIKTNRRGTLISTKQDKYRHGYGLKSIITAAEKYQGEVDVDSTDGMFTLTVVLNLKEL